MNFFLSFFVSCCVFAGGFLGGYVAMMDVKETVIVHNMQKIDDALKSYHNVHFGKESYPLKLSELGSIYSYGILADELKLRGIDDNLIDYNKYNYKQVILSDGNIGYRLEAVLPNGHNYISKGSSAEF